MRIDLGYRESQSPVIICWFYHVLPYFMSKNGFSGFMIGVLMFRNVNGFCYLDMALFLYKDNISDTI